MKLSDLPIDHKGKRHRVVCSICQEGINYTFHSQAPTWEDFKVWAEKDFQTTHRCTPAPISHIISESSAMDAIFWLVVGIFIGLIISAGLTK